MRLLAATFAAFALAGCTRAPALLHGCTTDSDCGDPLVFRCNLDTAQCLCRTNAACKAGEFCNSMGYCQAHVGCYETADCPDGFFCDPTSNVCLADGRCASDLDCSFGQLCDVTSQQCKAGCRVDGDCDLHQVCLCSSAGDGGQAEAPCACEGSDGGLGCPVGRCANGTCRDDSFCDWGQVCRTPSAGGLNTCQSDFDADLRPYCAECTDIPGVGACGQGANFCLFSTLTATTFCGVDCSQGQDCARGYSCQDVIVVWSRTECSSPDECMTVDHRSSLTCSIDSDCPNHGHCGHDPGAPVGFCYGDCVFDEGAKLSFCACIGDDDCAQDACVAESQTCSISRRDCDPSAGCRKLRCVDFGNQGGCLIGQNCAPLEGLTCADLAPP